MEEPDVHSDTQQPLWQNNCRSSQVKLFWLNIYSVLTDCSFRDRDRPEESRWNLKSLRNFVPQNHFVHEKLGEDEIHEHFDVPAFGSKEKYLWEAGNIVAFLSVICRTLEIINESSHVASGIYKKDLDKNIFVSWTNSTSGIYWIIG